MISMLLLLVLRVVPTLIQAGTLAGTVQFAEGFPAEGIRVAAVPESSSLDGSGLVLANIAKTDRRGSFRIEGLSAGRYYILAGRVDAPTLYPGVLSQEKARLVSLAEGAVLSGIDFILSEISESPRFASPYGNPPPLVAVYGRVAVESDSADQRIPATITFVTVTNGDVSVDTYSVNSDGRFRARLPQGRSSIALGVLPKGYSVVAMTFGLTDLQLSSLEIPMVDRASLPEIAVRLALDLTNGGTAGTDGLP